MPKKVNKIILNDYKLAMPRFSALITACVRARKGKPPWGIANLELAENIVDMKLDRTLGDI